MAPGRISLAALVALGLLSVPAQAETIQVTVDKLEFAPVDVNAKVGDTIEWVNKDAFAHTATATNGDWNVTLAPKQTGRLVLNKPGTIDYVSSQYEGARDRNAMRCG
ncbi:MAG: cupredoxin domain-containing protein [Pseudolabrys sp.]